MPNANARRRFMTYQLPNALVLGFTAVVLFFIASGVLSYMNLGTIMRDVARTTRTHDSLAKLEELLSLLKDAETGQRGYVITGDPRYLAPYNLAVSRLDIRLAEAVPLLEGTSYQKERLAALKESIAAKLAELGETIKVRREAGFDAARAVVMTDQGKEAMDAIRDRIQEISDAEQVVRDERMEEMSNAFKVALGSGLLATLLGVVLSGTLGFLVSRASLAQQRQDWLQRGTLGLGAALAGDQEPGQIGENALRFLAEYLDAHAAAFFVRSGSGFSRVATYGVPAQSDVPVRIELGDGLLGQAARDQRTFILTDVPPGYLTIGSSLGRTTPGHLMVAPVSFESEVIALLELGHLHTTTELARELIANASELIGRSVKAANYREHLHHLLEETRQQAEELQAQGEELRVSNEELEEQGRALRESQSRLELQQAELEQTNAQLEEHAGLLEKQRDDLFRAKAELQLKAEELEQASRYKSDFLANMSHELRTPLNSTLILAKLLADNPHGNLTDEQIRYAQTIRSAGNDLLTIINDILDLSKIEAGHMDVQIEEVPLAGLVEGLRSTFEPLALQKQLDLHMVVVTGCPEAIDTDRQRLEQILKNLISNAVKFTEVGSVTLKVSCAEGRVTFSVSDTGIGIPQEQQAMVFEAFRQADGTTNRKYGGTGLGLSIARELTRLLGGELQLSSEPGQGSTFSFTLPPVYQPELVSPRPTPAPAVADDKGVRPGLVTPPAALDTTEPAASRTRLRRFRDDRERLSGDHRVLLIVEDDESFARILADLAHELGFQCLVASTAEDAMAMAVQYLPSALVLDLGLPDHSGLTVLDRLKHDARTRHIPVHVVSGLDHTETAMALGAVGYLFKPVQREDLATALRQIESRLVRRMRRVLLVEDDAVQLDSLRSLLSSHEVEAVGVSTAAECLERLRAETFDCMVLDLSLPDASGYSLLETLSREDRYSFPPVIVYTGRVLSNDEEQRLRRYSKSIIIKGAKSPERLIDEVTLFLHQVVSELPPEQRMMLEQARSRDAAMEGRRILIVEDDVRNIFALTSVLEPRGVALQIARNGKEALARLEEATAEGGAGVDLVLMDVMMPEMDGLTATREIRKRPEWRRLPVIMLTAKAMKDDQQRCLDAGANDYLAKPLDVEKLLSLVRVWMPR